MQKKILPRIDFDGEVDVRISALGLAAFLGRVSMMEKLTERGAAVGSEQDAAAHEAALVSLDVQW